MFITIPEALAYSLLGIIIVFAALVILMLVIQLIAILGKTKKAPAPAAVSVQVQEQSAPPAPGSAGTCDLNGVDERTAAMLMAIIADKLELPLCQLRFRSIKEIK